MNARIINLRTRRKQKAREARKSAADANAIAHGQPKAVRDLQDARKNMQDRHLEGHKLLPVDPSDNSSNDDT